MRSLFLIVGVMVSCPTRNWAKDISEKSIKGDQGEKGSLRPQCFTACRPKINQLSVYKLCATTSDVHARLMVSRAKLPPGTTLEIDDGTLIKRVVRRSVFQSTHRCLRIVLDVRFHSYSRTYRNYPQLRATYSFVGGKSRKKRNEDGQDGVLKDRPPKDGPLEDWPVEKSPKEDSPTDTRPKQHENHKHRNIFILTFGSLVGIVVLVGLVCVLRLFLDSFWRFSQNCVSCCFLRILGKVTGATNGMRRHAQEQVAPPIEMEAFLGLDPWDVDRPPSYEQALFMPPPTELGPHQTNDAVLIRHHFEARHCSLPTYEDYMRATTEYTSLSEDLVSAR